MEEAPILQLDRWPILVVTPNQTFSNEDLHDYLASLEEIYQTRKEPYVLILDSRNGKKPDAYQRKVQNKFRQVHDVHIRTYCRGFALISNSELMKGVATAMYWLKKPTTETKFFTDFDEALAWSEEQLKS